MSLYAILMLAAALVILVRTTCLAAHLSAKNWTGHKARFAALAAAHSMLAAGALGVVLGWQHGAMLLLRAPRSS